MDKVEYAQYILEHVNGCADDCFDPLVRVTRVEHNTRANAYILHLTVDDQPEVYTLRSFDGSQIDPYSAASGDYLEGLILSLGEDVIDNYMDY